MPVPKPMPEIRVDDFLTAGHRFDEFGICVEPIPQHIQLQLGIDRCPVHWHDIDDIGMDKTLDLSSYVWVNARYVAHSGLLTTTEITQIMARKAKIVAQICHATGWRVE